MSDKKEPCKEPATKSEIKGPSLITVNWPTSGATAFPVALEYGLSWICASGTATDQVFDEFASDVYLKLSAAKPTASEPPYDAFHVFPSESNWEASSVYGANWHFYGDGAENHIGVWAYFPTKGYELFTSNFFGVLANTTSCAAEAGHELSKEESDDHHKRVCQDLAVAISNLRLPFLDQLDGRRSEDLANAFADQNGEGIEVFLRFLGYDIRLNYFRSPDPRTFHLVSDTSSGSRADVYVRWYTSSMCGDNREGSEGPKSLRISCVITPEGADECTVKPISTVHLQDGAADAGVFKNSVDCFEPGWADVHANEQVVELVNCNRNNTSGNPYSAYFGIRFPDTSEAPTDVVDATDATTAAGEEGK